MPKTRGFTLIELLVVISIIAILSVIGMTLFGSVQKSARDARRRGDIDAIASALEVAKTSTGYAQIYGTNFASGTVPTDSGNTVTGITYCVYSRPDYNTITVPTTRWTTTCPLFSESGTLVFPVTSGQIYLVSSATKWTVCASLETGTVYCKSSSQ